MATLHCNAVNLIFYDCLFLEHGISSWFVGSQIYIYTFLSINKSKPVQFLMTRPESLRCYEDEEEVLR